jgi:hypothetical protein
MRRTSKCADSPWISRRKSSAAKRPSPKASGNVFDVAASRTPRSVSAISNELIKHRVAGVVEFELVDADQRAV